MNEIRKFVREAPRFSRDEILAEIKAIEDEAAPLRDERERLATEPQPGLSMGQIKAKRGELSARIREIEADLPGLTKLLSMGIRRGDIPGKTVRVERAAPKKG